MKPPMNAGGTTLKPDNGLSVRHAGVVIVTLRGIPW